MPPLSAATWRRLVLEKLPLFALVGVSCVLTLYAQRYAMAPLASSSFLSRLASASTAYVVYLWQTLWPVNLACFYPHQRETWSSGWPIAAALLLIGMTLMVFRARRAPWLVVGWLWYLGTLVPVIGLIQVGGQARADRYTYVPLIGLFLGAAWSIPAQWWSAHRPKVATIAALGIGGLMLLSWRQVGYWRDGQTLFEHAVAVTEENWVAEVNLGYVRQKQGKLGEAERHYREALRFAPKCAMAHALLAELAQRRGDRAAALTHAQAAVESNPNIPEAQSALGMALVTHGNLAKAIEHFRLAIRLSPDQPEYHHFLGLALSDSDQLEPAAAAFRTAIRLKPAHAFAHNELGSILAKQGQTQQAIDAFQKALQINPGLVAAQNNLRNVLAPAEKRGAPPGSP
jgi:protein O-mannosyl-transferase